MSNEISIPIGVLPSEELAPMMGYMRTMPSHLEAFGENPDDMHAAAEIEKIRSGT